MTREELQDILDAAKRGSFCTNDICAVCAGLEAAWTEQDAKDKEIAALNVKIQELEEQIKSLAPVPMPPMRYPRIRDLPEAEREPFSRWLAGQTRPINNESEPESEWDWYYPWDYERWKAGLPVID